MLKKFVLAIAVAGGLASLPAPAAAENERCLLIAGCFWDGYQWQCPSPEIYMLCDVG